MTSDRIYQDEDGRWFFALRGDSDAGPYRTSSEAEAALERFVRRKDPLRSNPPLRVSLSAVRSLLGRAAHPLQRAARPLREDATA